MANHVTVEGAVEGKPHAREPPAQLMDRRLVGDGACDAGQLGDGSEVHFEGFQLVVFGGHQYSDGLLVGAGGFVSDEAQRTP